MTTEQDFRDAMHDMANNLPANKERFILAIARLMPIARQAVENLTEAEAREALTLMLAVSSVANQTPPRTNLEYCHDLRLQLSMHVRVNIAELLNPPLVHPEDIGRPSPKKAKKD